MKRVLVCGGREFDNYPWVSRILNNFRKEHGIATIVNGGARGADACAVKWAFKNRVPCWTFPADWDEYGKPAGAIRNQQMIDMASPDYVIAFPGNDGTRDMVRRAMRAGIMVLQMTDLPEDLKPKEEE